MWPFRRHYHHDHSHDQYGGQEYGHHHHRHDWRPLRRHRFISLATMLFALASFILFLLVALSLPIIKSIWLLSITAAPSGRGPATSIATEIKFGVWGFCADSALGVDQCWGPQLGYSLTSPINIAQLLGQPSLVNAISKGITVILVLHPVCAGLTFVVAVAALFLHNHGWSIVVLVLSIFTSLIGSISLAADLALVIVARDKVPQETDNLFSAQWGGAVWMVLAAVVCSWICVIFLSARACLCCGVRRKY